MAEQGQKEPGSDYPTLPVDDNLRRLPLLPTE
jgi:hypothetical protein